jgi:hypothetical protein
MISIYIGDNGWTCSRAYDYLARVLYNRGKLVMDMGYPFRYFVIENQEFKKKNLGPDYELSGDITNKNLLESLSDVTNIDFSPFEINYNFFDFYNEISTIVTVPGIKTKLMTLNNYTIYLNDVLQLIDFLSMHENSYIIIDL